MSNVKAPFLLRVIRFLFPILETCSQSLATRLFAWCFFVPLRYRMPSSEHKIFLEAEKSVEWFEGKKIQFYSWGEGPVVWVMHGWAGRTTQFRVFIKALTEAGFRVVGFDAPAHGQSQGKITNVLEFSRLLFRLAELHGLPQGAVTHSFGGMAMLYAIKNGLKVNRVVNVAAPADAQEIIRTFLEAVHASPKIGAGFQQYMIKHFGHPLDYYTILHSVKEIKDLDMLMFYDVADKEVPLVHALALKAAFPLAELVQTVNLSHNALLYDETVVKRGVAFIGKRD